MYLPVTVSVWSILLPPLYLQKRHLTNCKAEVSNKLVINRLPILTIPSWSSSVSQDVKMVVES